MVDINTEAKTRITRPQHRNIDLSHGQILFHRLRMIIWNEKKLCKRKNTFISELKFKEY